MQTVVAVREVKDAKSQLKTTLKESMTRKSIELPKVFVRDVLLARPNGVQLPEEATWMMKANKGLRPVKDAAFVTLWLKAVERASD